MTFSPLDSRLTGPLFVTDAMRDVFSDEARVAAMLRAEAALARAEASLGLAPDGLAAAVEAVTVASLDLPGIGTQTALAGVPTIPFVKAVQARLPAAFESAFHKGATTQDILDTALVLQVREALALVETEAASIVDGLATLATRHRETPCVGRTYGQQAAPISFGFKAAVWALGIAEVAAELPRIRERVLVASLAGPVGTLASLRDKGPVVADAFAADLGLGSAPAAWHVRRGAVAATGAWIAVLIGALAKMATDVVDLVSTEVGEAAEPYQPGRGGSSAMPHKRNPVSSTVILAAHSASKGHVVTLLDAMAGAHERPAGLWHAEWHALPQLFGLLSGALAEARTLAEGLEVNADRMRTNLDATRGLLFADAVASRLAPLIGRDAAHTRVEHAADAVRAGQGSLREVLERDASLPSEAGGALVSAFDLAPAVAAAALWCDRAVAAARDLVPARTFGPARAVLGAERP